MRIRGIGRLRRLTQPYTNLFFKGTVVLAYHRVNDLLSDPQLLSVTPRHFAEHVEIIRRQGYPTRLQEVSRALNAGERPPRGVAVTFDDGYADNLTNAKPALERYEVPATVFVTTGYVDSQRYFWWDELEQLLLHRQPLPERLCLHIGGTVHKWNLLKETNGAAYPCDHRWNVAETHDPSPRHALYRSLHRLLRPLPEAAQCKVLEELRAWTGIEITAPGGNTVLSTRQIVKLAEGGLIDVGSHSVTHPMFSALPLLEQCAEIQNSKAALEEILGRPVKSFAYPYGSKADYTENTAKTVERAGYASACANFSGIVTRYSDRFEIPRVLVRDWDGDEFSRRLAAWLSA
jgi:peptidoglycan/xylan/chitin deacetylase (PgdA/CDA1 family)